MNVCWVTVLTTVLLLTVLLFMYVWFTIDSPLDGPKDYKLLKPQKLRTGDLIGIAYDSMRGNLVKLFTGSAWTHLALILIFRDEPYIVEVAHYGLNSTGLIISPWSEFEKWNYGRIVAHRPYTGKTFPKKRLLNFLQSQTGIKMDMNVVSWLKSVIRRSYSRCDKQYYYCSEFIAHTLQELNILQKKVLASSYQPWEFIYGKLDLEEGYSYGDSQLLEGV